MRLSTAFKKLGYETISGYDEDSHCYQIDAYEVGNDFSEPCYLLKKQSDGLYDLYCINKGYIYGWIAGDEGDKLMEIIKEYEKNNV